MAYTEPSPQILWDTAGLFQGVTIQRVIQGQKYAWRIPYNGLVSQRIAADLLGVTVMSVNNWVRARKIKDVKIAGQPSAIPLSEIKRIRAVLAKEKQLRGR